MKKYLNRLGLCFVRHLDRGKILSARSFGVSELKYDVYRVNRFRFFAV